MFYIATTPAACTLCLLVLQNWCHLCTKNVPNWLPVLLITLANDVHLNPGLTFQINFFNFMSRSVNSLAKDNFQRVRLIEAHNSIFNYDLISVCETCLTCWGVDDLFTQVQNIPKKIIQISTTGRR